jgi:C4-dicarboxylate transporter DctQ subunit
VESIAKKLDDAVNRVERALILVCVVGMTALVGADVIQRTFSRQVGKTEQLVTFLADKIAGPLTPEARASFEGPIGGAVFVVFALVVIILAAHAARGVTAERKSQPPPKFIGSVIAGALVFVGLAIAVKALLWLFPSSVPGAQKFALGLMLWAGMLGASVAAKERRHIVVDAVTKKLDAGDKRLFALLGGLASGAFCGFVGYLSGRQLAGEIHDWATNEGVGLYESLPIPVWISTLAIPTAFILMGARFVGYGIRDFKHGPPTGGDGGHGVDLEELQKQTVEVPEVRA